MQQTTLNVKPVLDSLVPGAFTCQVVDATIATASTITNPPEHVILALTKTQTGSHPFDPHLDAHWKVNIGGTEFLLTRRTCYFYVTTLAMNDGTSCRRPIRIDIESRYGTAGGILQIAYSDGQCK